MNPWDAATSKQIGIVKALCGKAYRKSIGKDIKTPLDYKDADIAFSALLNAKLSRKVASQLIGLTGVSYFNSRKAYDNEEIIIKIIKELI